MRTIKLYIYCIWSLIKCTIFDLKKVKRWQKLKEHDKLENYFKKLIKVKTDKMFEISGIEVIAEGIDNVPKDGAVVFIGNHQGNLDVLALVNKSNRKIGFIGKDSFANIPILSTWLNLLGCFFIDRNNIRQTAKKINESIRYIKDGNCMGIFPEGTRSKSDDINSFKRGSFKIAFKTQSLIVPVSIYGTYKLWEGNNNKIKPGKIYIKYHKPLSTKNLEQKDYKDFTYKVENIIKDQVEKYKREY